MKARVASLAVLAVLISAPAVFCQSLDDLNINPGLMVMLTTDPLATAPSPIVASLGASLPIGVAGPFFVEPGIDIYGLNYFFDGEHAAPAAPETAAGFFTACILVGVEAGLRYPLAENLEIGGAAGADILIRFPLELFNSNPASIAGREPAGRYFYGSFRFVYPETRFFLRWQIIKEMGLVFSLKALYPIFHIWDGDGLAFPDQLLLSGTLGFAVRLFK
jgi:hypothetical protein